MKKTILLLFLVFQNVVSSQTISGFLLDSKTKKPIYKAHIKVDKNIFISDKNGFFSFSLKTSKKITISHVNYQTKNVEIKTRQRIKIFLTEKRESLGEIKIVSKSLQDKIKYTKLQDLPFSTYSFGAVLKGNKIYVFAGNASFIANSYLEESSKLFIDNMSIDRDVKRLFSTPKFKNFISYKKEMLIYDIEANTWAVSKDKVRERANLSAFLLKEKIYLLGGKRKTKRKQYLDDKVEVYNLKKDSISVDDTNPHQAVNFASSIYKNKIIVSGGSTKIKNDGDKVYSNEVHFFDTETGYWYLLTKMKKGKETTSTVLGNKLYFFGGFRKEKLKEIESYNLITDTWTTEGTLFKKLGRPAITKNKEIIYLFENNQIITFNTVTRVLKEYEIELPFFAPEMFYKDNYLYILGGYKEIDFSISASKKAIRVSLEEFEKTKKINQKTL